MLSFLGENTTTKSNYGDQADFFILDRSKAEIAGPDTARDIDTWPLISKTSCNVHKEVLQLADPLFEECLMLPNV